MRKLIPAQSPNADMPPSYCCTSFDAGGPYAVTHSGEVIAITPLHFPQGSSAAPNFHSDS
jgi:hypothetical protein